MNEPNEFRIMYSVQTEEYPGPWVHSVENSMEDAYKAIQNTIKWLKERKYVGSVWIESRYVSDWVPWHYSN